MHFYSSLLLVVWASEYTKPMGEKEANLQITRLEQNKWPQTEAHSQSLMLGDEPHIRIACNASHCAYRLKGVIPLILRFDQIEETRYRPAKAASNSNRRPRAAARYLASSSCSALIRHRGLYLLSSEGSQR